MIIATKVAMKLIPVLVLSAIPAAIITAELAQPVVIDVDKGAPAAVAGSPIAVPIVAPAPADGPAKPRDANERKLLYAAALAAFLRWLVRLLEKIPLVGDRKRHLPAILSVVGVAIGAVDYYAMGGDLVGSIIIGGAGPGAVLANELMNWIAGLKKEAAPVTPPPVPPAVQ